MVSDTTLSITAHVVSMICSLLNYQAVQFARENHTHLKDVTLSEYILEENLPVDILIGADQYWNIANGEGKHGESGPIAIIHSRTWPQLFKGWITQSTG